MVALYNRAQTGQGQIVDGSLLATGVTLMQPYLAEQSVTGVARTRRGNAAFYTAPSDTYRTLDGWFILQVIGPEMFARWARLVGREEFIGDPRFATDLSRADHRDVLTDAMNAWLATRTAVQALAELEAARVPAGPVLDIGEVLEDQQVKARGLLQYLDYPGAPKPVPLADTAVRLSETPGSIRHRAPKLGEHTDCVLEELGYSAGDIARLRAAGVV